MHVSIAQYADDQWSTHAISKSATDQAAQLVLCFASKELLESPTIYDTVRARFPTAEIALCSTAGEIYHDRVQDDTLVAVAMSFGDTHVRTASVNIGDFATSLDAARQLASLLPADELAYVLILADGALVNGSELVKGLCIDDQQILITGGLAGDAAKFQSTLVGLNGPPIAGQVTAIGFYGQKLLVGHGSAGGWTMFGLEKEITRATGNVLYEIDHENALDLYKKYLGPDVEQLPGAALYFPLSVTIPGEDKPVVRTILSIDEAQKSMTFAGDVPVGARVRFMKASFDRLTAAAATAAQQTALPGGVEPALALLVSCVGRKLIYGPRIDEEVEAVSETLGQQVPLIGFYANGELSPVNEGGSCQLHNQTMTITAFYELP
ncbi:FIST signal transduction protein [Fibrella sp. WM1]|uniref:FIST signal transduction protein n=1 Tax=Fibrella musci TaxID=3242485 RepID=UPI00351FB580